MRLTIAITVSSSSANVRRPRRSGTVQLCTCADRPDHRAGRASPASRATIRAWVRCWATSSRCSSSAACCSWPRRSRSAAARRWRRCCRRGRRWSCRTTGSPRGDDLRALKLSVALRGYRMDEVDWLLDRLSEQVDTRDREIARLRSVLHVERVPAEASRSCSPTRSRAGPRRRTRGRRRTGRPPAPVPDGTEVTDARPDRPVRDIRTTRPPEGTMSLPLQRDPEHLRRPEPAAAGGRRRRAGRAHLGRGDGLAPAARVDARHQGPAHGRATATGSAAGSRPPPASARSAWSTRWRSPAGTRRTVRT